MKKIELDGKEYEICTSWDDVTIRKQIQVSIDKDKQETDILKNISIISGYSNIPLQVLKRTKLSNLNEVFKYLTFIKEELPSNKIDKFEFNGETYYVSQNLMEQTFEDYVSLQNIIDRFKETNYKGLPYIMAVMCKRMKDDGTLESLDDYDVEKRAEEFMDINISICNGVTVFFSQSINALWTISNLYSNPKEIVETKMVGVENTLKELDGRGLHMRLLNGILRSYLKYIRRKLAKYFIS